MINILERLPEELQKRIMDFLDMESQKRLIIAYPELKITDSFTCSLKKFLSNQSLDSLIDIQNLCFAKADELKKFIAK